MGIHSDVVVRRAVVWRPALLVILLAAFALRLIGIRFGLPSLYDADEGFFIITGIKLLRERTLNPGWFGHPGTITIYSIALVEAATVGWNLAVGRFADLNAFGRAMYLDTGIVLVPLRLMIVACGLASVLVAALIARRVHDAKVGLTAAALIAVCPLHVALSQVVRTDIQASLLMLTATWFATGIVRTGRARDYLLAGLFVGLATATKWPAATALAAIVAGCAARCRTTPHAIVPQLRLAAAAVAVAVLTLLAVSPFLVLDHASVARDLGGDLRPHHVGATGGGLLANLAWYVSHPLVDAFGLPALLLAVIGVADGVRRPLAWPVLAAAAAFLIGIAAHGLLWPRWVVPMLPFVAILAAAGLWRVAGLARGRARGVLLAALALAVVIPLATRAVASARERLNDTRDVGEAWLAAHVPAGDTVLAEYFAIGLMRHPWRFRFPAGDPGCIDPLAAARGQIKVATINRMRGTRAVVDIGGVAPNRLTTCRADYALITNYDRYLVEPVRYAREIASYRALTRGGRTVLTVRPEHGRVGGPVVRIVRLAPLSPGGVMVDKP